MLGQMQTRLSLGTWRATFLAALTGLPVASCLVEPEPLPGNEAGSGGSAGTSGTSGTAGSSGTAGTAGTSGTAGTGGSGAMPVCQNPQLPGSIDQGFVLCEGGVYHRPERRTCAIERPVGGLCPSAPGDVFDECESDADCTEGPHGACTRQNFGPGGPPGAGCGCTYGCASDAECDAGQLCLCADGGDQPGHCVQAECTGDDDCGPGALCASYSVVPGCGPTAFACQRPGDECLSNADCSASPAKFCAYGEGGRVCGQATCSIGRPFVVEGAVRFAPLAGRSDWARPTELGAGGPDAALCERLAAEWARAGQMEHASVAAFARFTLQLLALGAPPGLVADAQAAALDELEHARLCFGLASAYAGRPLGPGPLPVDGALADMSLEGAVLTAVVEGCVGETLAALEAAEAREWAREGAARDALSVIVGDEARHAELAWRFVAWGLERGGAPLRAAVGEAFARAFGEGAGAEAVADGEGDALLAHGVLPEARRAELRRRALREVVAPCAERLLGRPALAAAAAVEPVAAPASA